MTFLRYLLLLGFALPAHAHDLWFEKEGDARVLLQGHRHSAHEGAELVPYEAATVKALTCVDASGKARPLAPGKTAPVKVSGDCAVLHATFSSGYWTKTAWETKNTPKTGITGVIKSWYSEESLKLVQHWTGAAPIGTGLELTPVSDPLGLSSGDKVTVLVTDNGKPVAGVPVAYGGDTRGASGDDGKVSIRLRHPGIQLIEASLETPLGDGKADTSIRTTSLQFEVAK